MESRQQGPPAKKTKTVRGRLLAAHCRAEFVTECMKKKKKNTNIIGDFRFRFSAENECPFSFRFRP